MKKKMGVFILYVILSIYVLIMLILFIWVLLVFFKMFEEIVLGMGNFILKYFMLDNYK